VSGAPKDWTIGVTYGSTASQTVAANPVYLVSNPKYVAIDSLGNVWFVNSAGLTGNSVSELSATGVPEALVLTGAGTLIAPSGIAVDPSNNLFVPNYGASGTGNTVTEYTSLGSTRTFTLKSTGPEAIASDGAGNIFVASAGVSAGTGDIEAIAAGAASGAATVTQASNVSVGANSALAVDENFNLWLSNSSNTAITQFLCVSTPCTATVSSLPPNPDSIAVDHAGNIWVGNISGSLTELAATSNTTITQSANSPFTGGGLTGPFTGLIDGLGNVWESDFITGSGTVSELTGSGKAISPSSGFTHTFNGATGLAIDGAGNVWIGNSTATASGTTAGYITEIVGEAAPVVTPLAAGLPAVAGGQNTLGTRP
jgi:sugar lactone lactonase YvrE